MASFQKVLQAKYPGNISHSRWLTTENRIFRLYASKDCPSDNLIALTTFVIRVYAPTWFDIKRSSKCQNGARYLWSMTTRSRYLAEGLKKVHDNVIQRNAYYAHQENLLIAMITVSKSCIRELGFRRILKARGQPEKGHLIRSFKVPQINFQAADYTHSIAWNGNNI